MAEVTFVVNLSDGPFDPFNPNDKQKTARIPVSGTITNKKHGDTFTVEGREANELRLASEARILPIEEFRLRMQTWTGGSITPGEYPLTEINSNNPSDWIFEKLYQKKILQILVIPQFISGTTFEVGKDYVDESDNGKVRIRFLTDSLACFIRVIFEDYNDDYQVVFINVGFAFFAENGLSFPNNQLFAFTNVPIKKEQVPTSSAPTNLLEKVVWFASLRAHIYNVDAIFIQDKFDSGNIIANIQTAHPGVSIVKFDDLNDLINKIKAEAFAQNKIINIVIACRGNTNTAYTTSLDILSPVDANVRILRNNNPGVLDFIGTLKGLIGTLHFHSSFTGVGFDNKKLRVSHLITKLAEGLVSLHPVKVTAWDQALAIGGFGGFQVPFGAKQFVARAFPKKGQLQKFLEIDLPAVSSVNFQVEEAPPLILVNCCPCTSGVNCQGAGKDQIPNELFVTIAFTDCSPAECIGCDTPNACGNINVTLTFNGTNHVGSDAFFDYTLFCATGAFAMSPKVPFSFCGVGTLAKSSAIVYECDPVFIAWNAPFILEDSAGNECPCALGIPFNSIAFGCAVVTISQ